MSRRRISCQGKKDFVVRQKIVGLQMLSTASLKFGDSWENFGDKKKIVSTGNGFLLTEFFFVCLFLFLFFLLHKKGIKKMRSVNRALCCSHRAGQILDRTS